MIDSTIKHPAEFLKKTFTDTIRSAAREAERLHALHPDQLDMIYSQQWFNMFVPVEYGGRGMSLPEILRTEESLAWADGSTAWTATLCSGAAWFIGFLDPDLRREVFSDRHACFAGSGAATGSATVTADGFEIEGFWKYASGAQQATIFTVNCNVVREGKALCHADGTAMIRSFFLKRDEVTLHPTWNSMGMIATGSHSFEVKKVQVPMSRSFMIDPAYTTLKHPVFQYPFRQLAETTLTVNLSGMAVRFMDLCQEIADDKKNALVIQKSEFEKPDFGQRLVLAKAKLDEYRRIFYSAAETSWEALLGDSAIPGYMLDEVSLTSRTLVRHAYQTINALYPLCGLQAADLGQEINRVWRNFHTASQHALFRNDF